MSLKKYIVRTGHRFRRDDGSLALPGDTIELDASVAAMHSERCYPVPAAAPVAAVAPAAQAAAAPAVAAPAVTAALPAVK